MPATYAVIVARTSASSVRTWASATRRNPSVRDSRSIGSAPGPSSSARRPRPARAISSSWKRAILSVAEAEPEPGVGVVAGLDVRDPPSVTVDDDLVPRVPPRAAPRASGAAAGRGRGAAFECRAGRASAA